MKYVFYSAVGKKSSRKLFCALSHKYILKFQLQNCVGRRKLAHMTSKTGIYTYSSAFWLFTGSVGRTVMHFYIASIHRRKRNAANGSGVLFLQDFASVIPRANNHYSILLSSCSHYKTTNNVALMTVSRARTAQDGSRKGGRYHF